VTEVDFPLLMALSLVAGDVTAGLPLVDPISVTCNPDVTLHPGIGVFMRFA
jgi:hypothetical protein